MMDISWVFFDFCFENAARGFFRGDAPRLSDFDFAVTSRRRQRPLANGANRPLASPAGLGDARDTPQPRFAGLCEGAAKGGYKSRRKVRADIEAGALHPYISIRDYGRCADKRGAKMARPEKLDRVLGRLPARSSAARIDGWSDGQKYWDKIWANLNFGLNSLSLVES